MTPALLELLPKKWAQRYDIFPVEANAFSITLASSQRLNPEVLENLRFSLERTIHLRLYPKEKIENLIKEYYSQKVLARIFHTDRDEETAKAHEVRQTNIVTPGYMCTALPKSQCESNATSTLPSPVSTVDECEISGLDEYAQNFIPFTIDTDVMPRLMETMILCKDNFPNNTVEKNPVIQYVTMLLDEAIEKEASDLHVEAFEHECRIRYRIDGLLCEKKPLPLTIATSIISRFKLLAQLDITESRLPQDGRLQHTWNKITVDGIKKVSNGLL
jgi:type II secretory ATPase GspE/PulE/Tfp pilus assembly ATPase PilB-like protein